MTQKPLNTQIYTYQDRKARYEKYLQGLQTRRFITGMDGIDGNIRGVAPGEVMTIIAYSGTFKSAFLQNLLQKSAHRSDLYQVFFSLEMPVEKVFEREIQITGKVDGWKVEKDYAGNATYYDDLAKARGSEKVIVIEEGRLDIPRLERYIHMVEAKHGEVGCIGIDYLGLMKGEGKTIFEKTAEISYGVKEKAKALQKPIIMLCQVSRAYSESKGLEIEMDAAKGGGDIEAGADFLLGFYNHEEDLICKILKNRNGQKNIYFKVDLDRNCLRFNSMERWEPPKKQKGKTNEHNPYA